MLGSKSTPHPFIKVTEDFPYNEIVVLDSRLFPMLRASVQEIYKCIASTAVSGCSVNSEIISAVSPAAAGYLTNHFNNH